MIDPRGMIKKATLTFEAKSLYLLIRHWLSPMKEDNVFTYDRTVMVAALVAILEINIAKLMLAVTHEREFKTSTIYPFPCFIL